MVPIKTFAITLIASAALIAGPSAFAQKCETLTLGAAISLTGKYSTNGFHAKNGYEFAVKKINDAGGIKVGDNIMIGDSELKTGNVIALGDIPEGTLIHNIELRPGDGGKLVRSSGTFAKVVAKSEKTVRVILPSKKEKIFPISVQ